MHPQVIESEGKKAFVILPYEEFLEIQEQLSDYQDIKDLREAKRLYCNEESVPLKAIREDLLRN